MSIKRDIWRTSSFTLNGIPAWPCPNCNTGILTLVKDDIIKKTKSSSFHNDGNNAFSNYNPDILFAAIFKCSHSNCSASVTSCGYGKRFDLNTKIEVANEYVGKTYTLYYPKYFYPSPNIFQISKYCPELIKEEILNAFSLFWINKSAAGNKIRSVIELMLTNMGVIGSENGSLKLHARINLFRETNVEIANHLEAIKWIGNSGSHGGELTLEDLLDGFELLEYCVNQLYHDAKDKERIQNISSEINKGKKPLSKKAT